MKHLPLLLSMALAEAACSPAPDSAPTAPAPPAVSVPAEAPVDKVPGFRTHRFGDDLASFPPLVLVHQSTPDLGTYARPKGQEDLLFAKTKLSGINYTFYQGKLSGVTLLVNTPTALQHLSAAAVARYGPPNQQFEDLPAWVGARVQAAFGRPGASSGRQDTAYLQLLDKATLSKILADRQRAQDAGAPGSAQ